MKFRIPKDDKKNLRSKSMQYLIDWKNVLEAGIKFDSHPDPEELDYKKNMIEVIKKEIKHREDKFWSLNIKVTWSENGTVFNRRFRSIHKTHCLTWRLRKQGIMPELHILSDGIWTRIDFDGNQISEAIA